MKIIKNLIKMDFHKYEWNALKNSFIKQPHESNIKIQIQTLVTIFISYLAKADYRQFLTSFVKEIQYDH